SKSMSLSTIKQCVDGDSRNALASASRWAARSAPSTLGNDQPMPLLLRWLVMRVIEPVKGIIVVSRDVGVAMKMCGRMAGSERRRNRVPIRPGVENRIALRAAGTTPMALAGHVDDQRMAARTRDIGHSAIVGYFDHAGNHRC